MFGWYSCGWCRFFGFCWFRLGFTVVYGGRGWLLGVLYFSFLYRFSGVCEFGEIIWEICVFGLLRFFYLVCRYLSFIKIVEEDFGKL